MERKPKPSKAPRKHLKRNEEVRQHRIKKGQAASANTRREISRHIELSTSGYFDDYEEYRNASVRTFDEKRQAVFLLAYLKTNSIVKAAKAAGISRVTVYKRLRSDQDFYEMVEDIKEANVDSLEEACFSRARDGVLDPVYQGGELVGHKRVYSDGLAMFLLKFYRQGNVGDTKPSPDADGSPDPTNIHLSAKMKLAEALSRRTKSPETEEDAE